MIQLATLNRCTRHEFSNFQGRRQIGWDVRFRQEYRSSGNARRRRETDRWTDRPIRQTKRRERDGERERTATVMKAQTMASKPGVEPADA